MPSFESLYRFFGARVDDVDLTSQLVEAVFAKIRAAFEQYSLLVFSNHALRDDKKVVFFRWLRSLVMTKVGAMGEGTELLILTNVDLDDGATTPTDHRLHRTHHANSLWHTDRSFKKYLALASLSSARIVPPVGVETELAGMRVACAGLDDEPKQRVEGRIAKHSFANSRKQIDAELMTVVERNEILPVSYLLVSTNPATGKNHSTSPPMGFTSWICRSTRERR